MKESKEELIDKIATIVLVVVLVLVPLITSIGDSRDFPRMIILLSCGLALLALIPFKLKIFKIDKIDICVFLFATLATLSTVFSSRIEISFMGSQSRYEGILMIFTYILIYFHSKYSFIKFKKLENILLVEYIAICILTIVQYYLPDNLNIPLISGSPTGTFGNTNFLGCFVSLILPAFMFKFISAGKIKYAFGSATAFSAMIMCGARSSWVAFIAYALGIIVYLIKKREKKKFKLFVILIIIFIICFTVIKLSSFNNKWVDSRFKLVDKELKLIREEGLSSSMGSGRIAIWETTLDVIARKPLLGCGVDNLYFGMAECSPEKLLHFIHVYKVIIDKAHNEYMQIAATMGIPALISYIGFVGGIMTLNFKKCFKDDKSMLFVLVIGSYITQAFFNISIISVAPIFWFALGMAAREVKKEKN